MAPPCFQPSGDCVENCEAYLQMKILAVRELTFFREKKIPKEEKPGIK